MIAVVHDDDRAVETERVEVVPSGREPARQVAPPHAAHPTRVGFRYRLAQQRGMQRLEVGDSRQVGPARGAARRRSCACARR